MSLALVTGASSGLGRALVPALAAAGYRLRLTARSLAGLAGDMQAAADLTRDPLAPLVAGTQLVFHLAALSSPWGKRAVFEAINVTATARLLRAAQKAGVRRFVHVSSPSIYAEPRDRLKLTEQSPLAGRFLTHYAATKWAGERLVLAADSAAMRTIVLRPRAIVGPHDRVLLPRLIRAARTGRVPLPGGGRALVELTDARDVAAALIAAAERPAGGAFNIAGGRPLPARVIVERVCAGLGLSPRLVSVPRRLALAAARLAESVGAVTDREPVVTRHAVVALGWSQTFDLSLARDQLGWKPRIAPEQAIADAVAAICVN